MAFDTRAQYDKNLFYYEVLKKLDGLSFAAGGSISLGVFQATSAGTGYAVGDLIGLIQEPPAAPQYVNIGSNATITPNPAHLGPVGGGATVTVNGVNAAIQFLPVLYDAGASVNQQGFAWFRWNGTTHAVLGVVNTAGTIVTTPTNIRPTSGAAGATTNPPTLDQGTNLASIDTDAEALVADPTANTAGAPTVAFTLPELSRWVIRLYQILLTRMGATADAASATGSMFARSAELLARLGGAPTAANASGTIREQLRAIAESSGAARPVIGVQYFKPIQTLVPAGIPAGIPASGQAVSFTVTPIAGINTDVAFQNGDIVVLTDMTDAAANAVAYVQVSSVTSNTVSGVVLQRSNSATAGTVFTAGASTAVRHTEVSGQTRLPSIPTAAVSAEVTVVESNAIAAASVTAGSPYQTVAQLLMGGWPLARAGCRIGAVADIDGIDRLGFNMSRESVKKFETRAEVDAARILSATPMALLPIIEVEYR